MKKYTNKILIITAIILVLGITIDFQTGYRSGRIKYEKIEKDSTQVITLDDLDAYVDSVETRHGTFLQDSEKEPETSHQ